MKPQLPECASWNVWIGKEIEGTVDVGEITLFIRKLNPLKSLADYGALIRERHISRLWFCAEFKDWNAYRTLSSKVSRLCFEVNHQTLGSVPTDIRQSARLYYKLPACLKQGDFVCVGPAYADEAFKIGLGATVAPELYGRDERID